MDRVHESTGETPMSLAHLCVEMYSSKAQNYACYLTLSTFSRNLKASFLYQDVPRGLFRGFNGLTITRLIASRHISTRYSYEACQLSSRQSLQSQIGRASCRERV